MKIAGGPWRVLHKQFVNICPIFVFFAMCALYGLALLQRWRQETGTDPADNTLIGTEQDQWQVGWRRRAHEYELSRGAPDPDTPQNHWF